MDKRAPSERTLPSLATADWLHAPALQKVFTCLAASGFEARVVGGAVRNALLGRPVADIDIATIATPDQVIAAAKAHGLKTVATGIGHGTVTVIVTGQPFEVTTLRRDVDTDGRHATVAFTGDWAADAARRDLTLNALYCDATGKIFDPLGGIDDLLSKRVRFVGDPRQRIREDYLRILRFFRFTAEYADGPPDMAGLQAAVAERGGLRQLSAERVRAELVRLLAAPRAAAVVASMAEYGLLTTILPVAPRLGVFDHLAAIEIANGLKPKATLRLAALAVAVSEDAFRLAEHLRLSSAERDTLVRAAASIDVSPALDNKVQRTMLYRLGETGFGEAVLLAWAWGSASVDDCAWKHLLELPRRWSAPLMPFAGRDIVARGVAPGPRVGEVIRAFENWWIANDFPVERELVAVQLDKILTSKQLH
jgi:poly(A) polymerase